MDRRRSVRTRRATTLFFFRRIAARRRPAPGRSALSASMPRWFSCSATLGCAKAADPAAGGPFARMRRPAPCLGTSALRQAPGPGLDRRPRPVPRRLQPVRPCCRGARRGPSGGARARGARTGRQAPVSSRKVSSLRPSSRR